MTKEQIRQIKRVTLSRILCDSSDGMKFVPKHAFDQIKSNKDLLSCQQVESANYNVWKETL